MAERNGMRGRDVVTVLASALGTGIALGYASRKLGLTYGQRAAGCAFASGVVGTLTLKASVPAGTGILATGMLLATSNVVTAVRVSQYLGTGAGTAPSIQRPTSTAGQLSAPSTVATTTNADGTTSATQTNAVVGTPQPLTIAPGLRRVGG